MQIGTLIVDDEADIRFLLRTLIEMENKGLFVSGEAVDGDEAIARADELDPAIIVIDERMPGRSGVDTIRELRQRRPGQQILLCSAHLDPDLHRRAEAAGAQVCVPKSRIQDIPRLLRDLAG